MNTPSQSSDLSNKGLYLVTGAAGFIGSNIAAALDARGARVAICDRLRDGLKWRNISKRELSSIIHPDDLDDYLKAHEGAIEAVIHMGAISSTTETNVDLIVETNYQLTLSLWNWCAHRSVPFIYASSAATYGDGAHGFDDDQSLEGLAGLKPLNAYGWSKHLFDRRVARTVARGDHTPPQWVGLKFFNVYGPNEYHKGSMQSVVSQLYPRAVEGAKAKLFKSHNPDYEDGGQLRDFIWVDDCVDIIMWCLDNRSVSGIFNCGTGQARSFADLARAVYAALDKDIEFEFLPTPENIRDKYQYFTQASMDRFRQVGYDKPMTSLEDGVRQYICDYLHTDDPYR
ncbi:MAG: ADP-glyceromanno-heptose 6-epimerase [Rhodospirillales bacterium]|nr:ADP-glyceromanno-heptose 6-epimerase [Rhodospirillales bacterium]